MGTFILLLLLPLNVNFFSKGMGNEGKFERIGICCERWLTLVQFAFSE